MNNEDSLFNNCSFPVDEKYYVQDGDLLISWSGTPETSFGIFIWSRGTAILNQHIFNVKIRTDSIRRLYFYYSYKNLLNQMIGSAHGGVGLKHITKTELLNLRVPVPEGDEQDRISQVLQEIDGLLEREHNYKIKLLSLKRGLMQDLLNGKMRVTNLFK